MHVRGTTNKLWSLKRHLLGMLGIMIDNLFSI